MGATPSTTAHTSSSTPAPSTCPHVRTSTVTSYNSTTSTFPTTTTVTIPIYPNVVLVYSSSLSTIYESPLNTTVTSTSYLNTSIVVVPAKKTTTVHTPSGFTPVLCEAAWVQPTVSNTGVSTFTSTGLAYSESTDYATVTSTGTLITGVSYSTLSTTVTITSIVMATTASTSTRKQATSTVYAACASNNVVRLVPNGQFINNVDLDSSINQVLITAIDEYDCCALCQANATCIGSIYLAKYPYYDLGTRKCDLLFRNDGVCDPKYSGDFNVTGQIADDNWTESFISNSGCGQFFYDPNLYQSPPRS